MLLEHLHDLVVAPGAAAVDANVGVYVGCMYTGALGAAGEG